MTDNKAARPAAPDVLDWLQSERDRHATARDEFFRTSDWASGNMHDEQSTRLYEAIAEIQRLRGVNAVMKDVLMNRIILSYRRQPQEPRE